MLLTINFIMKQNIRERGEEKKIEMLAEKFKEILGEFPSIFEKKLFFEVDFSSFSSAS